MRYRFISVLALFITCMPLSAHAATLQESVEQRRQARLAQLEQTTGSAQTTAEMRTRLRSRALAAQSSRRAAAAQTTKKLTVRNRADVAEQVITLVNAERAKVNLPALTYNLLLTESALLHAKDMDDRGYFNHITPEGLAPQDRIRQTGYLDRTTTSCDCTSYSYAIGENIAEGQVTAEEVMRDWMNSPLHKANILSADFSEIGVGVWRDVWVQNFGQVKRW